MLHKTYPTMMFNSYTSECIDYVYVEQPKYKNILVFGNVGNGKSTILNKIYCMLNDNM